MLPLRTLDHKYIFFRGGLLLFFQFVLMLNALVTLNLIMIRSVLKALLCPQHFLNLNKFRYSRACNPEAILRSGPKSNSSGILCLPRLKALSCPQHFLDYKIRRSRARKNKAYCPIWPKIELIQDIMNL